MKTSFLPFLALSLAIASIAAPIAFAQEEAAPKKPAPSPKGEETPNTTVVFPPAPPLRPLKVAIYDGPGSGDPGIGNVTSRVAMIPGSVVTKLKPEEVGTVDLAPYDIIVFSGGSGSAQAKAIGEKGVANVRQFVKNGGAYLGICAGAYLATAGYPWSLGILNAKTIQPWQRGGAFLQLEMTDDGRKTFGSDVKDKFWVRYHNGPVIEPANKPDLPPYTVDAYFRSEVYAKGAAGVQINSPAVISGVYGKGRVLSISPHPEDSKGLENFVPRGLAWLAGGEKTIAKAN